uniref:Hc58 n=1 Tax=Haemonchus contortus TaxID=6289 RepID=Q58HK5_HAECO|nr:Hc58 [Haemonchus contortus]
MTMSDRACIHSKGKAFKARLSDTDILSCCGKDPCQIGEGGISARAWLYAMQYGVCTGGYYERYGYGKRYKLDKVLAKAAYRVPRFEELDIPESAIQMQIMNKGPVQAIRDQSNCGSCWAVSAAETMSDRACIHSKGKFKARLSDGVCKPYVFHPCGNHAGQKYYGKCPDDRSFKTPVCKQYCQRSRGRHAVKMIGWGVENGTKYWLIANSWNKDWGEERSFRNLQRVDNCGIESAVVAGDF